MACFKRKMKLVEQEWLCLIAVRKALDFKQEIAGQNGLPNRRVVNRR